MPDVCGWYFQPNHWPFLQILTIWSGLVILICFWMEEKINKNKNVYIWLFQFLEHFCGVLLLGGICERMKINKFLFSGFFSMRFGKCKVINVFFCSKLRETASVCVCKKIPLLFLMSNHLPFTIPVIFMGNFMWL